MKTIGYQHPEILNCVQEGLVVEIEWSDLDEAVPPDIRCSLCGVLLDQLVPEELDDEEQRT